MSKYQFNSHERYAIFTVHHEKCYLCTKPLDLQSMQVDHIIPESLQEDKEKRESILKSFGLASDFELNSPKNWLPSCPSCNRTKSATAFNPTPIIQIQIQQASIKAEKVKELIDKTCTRREITMALNKIQRADKEGALTEADKETLKPLYEFHQEERSEELKGSSMALSPFYQILGEEKGMLIIKSIGGIGYRPIGATHPSWDCPNCGSIAAWNGSRCVVCGQMNDE